MRRDPVAVLYAAFVCSLPLGRPAVFHIGSSGVQLADLLLAATYLAWGVRWVRRRPPVRWSPVFWTGLAYLAVLGVSSVLGALPVSRSVLKLAAYAMYVLLPALSVNVLADEDRLAFAVRSWLVGGAACVLVGASGIALFYIDRRAGGLLACGTYGLLPSGNYPRLCSTFGNPNMHANYLTTVFALGLGCGTLLAPRRYVIPALALCTFVVLFTLSAGFAGYLLAGAIVLLAWRRQSGRRWSVVDTGLVAGTAVACAFFALSMIAVLVPAGEGHFSLGSRDIRLWHGSRPAIWASAAQTFLEHPWLGKGYGTDVAYSDDPAVVLSPDQIARLDGPMKRAWLEGHNVWLSVAGQGGIAGLIAFGALVLELGRCVWAVRTPNAAHDRTALLGPALLGIFVGAFVYHGLFGAFEEARHLWAFFGLVAATAAIRAGRVSQAATLEAQRSVRAAASA